MSPLKLLVLLLLGTAFLASPSFGQLAVPGDVLFEEAFADGPFPRGKNTLVGDTGWVARTTFGNWVKTDAGIEGTINPDDGHTPVIAFTPPAELEDLIVELEFRFQSRFLHPSLQSVTIFHNDEHLEVRVCHHHRLNQHNVHLP